MSANDRLQLFNTLAALPPPAFNKLLFAIKPPDGVVAGPTAPQGDRAYQLLQWAESPTGPSLAFVQDVLNRLNSLPGPPKSPRQAQDIEALVSTIRAQVHGDIQARCGTMRVLDMEQPIGLGNIYTSVNILEKLSGSRRLGLEELLQDCDLENFDRFLLGQVRHKRVPGLKAVERHNQLMILGKPGAGKTTFMKRLAIFCNQGEFQPQRVPVFVALKEYAETEDKPKLQTYIQTQWNACGVEAADALSTVLGSGQALVLLDGLDEVYKTDHDRVLQDIKTFAYQFRDCQCVITCRIAAREYIFEQFTEVEVADFDQDQIAEFATKWFKAKNDPKKAKTLIQWLNANETIRELATNPLLLTLLCLVFGEATALPANRAGLYKEGLDKLLQKWDTNRNIKRDQTYKKLSLKHKEDLLSQLAFENFEKGDYFFKQSVVEHKIIQYIHNLPGASENEEALQLDGEAILKSIEAQHGLLIERARGIYSFSHLTFQEYFTSRQITSPTANANLALRSLAVHITEKRYREIFLLAVEMLPAADRLLALMKRYIDQLMVDFSTEEPKLQESLTWAQQKSASVYTNYKPSSIRALYHVHGTQPSIFICTESQQKVTVHLIPLHNSTLASAIDCNFASDLKLACGFSPVILFDKDLLIDFSLYQALSLSRNFSWMFLPKQEENNDRITSFHLVLEYILDCFEEAVQGDDCKLFIDLQFLRSMPKLDNLDSFREWWQQNNKAYVDQLRSDMIKSRNIGHDWQFTETQKEKLRQYYDANQLLVDCLNSGCCVTKATRQYIEDTLLLPLSEIEKYPVPDAIANL